MMGLKFRLIAGYICVSVIVLMVGITGWEGVRRTTHSINDITLVQLPGINSLMKIQQAAISINAAQRTLLNPDLGLSGIETQYDHIARARKNYQDACGVYQKLPKTPEEEKLWQDFVVSWQEWQDVSDNFLNFSKKLVDFDILNPLKLRQVLEGFKSEHYFLLAQVGNMLQTEIEFDGSEDTEHCSFTQWLNTFKTRNTTIANAITNMHKPHQDFHDAIAGIKEFIRKGEIDKASFVFEEAMLPASENLFKKLDFLNEQAGIAYGLYDKMNSFALNEGMRHQRKALSKLEEIITLNTQSSLQEAESAETKANRNAFITMTGVIAGFVIALVMGIMISNFITTPLKAAINSLTDTSHRLSHASLQISSASETIADNASQQAASIEETSASLNQLASMTKQNASSAQQANTLMNASKQIVNDTNSSMTQLTDSMRQIHTASQEARKIIHAIDEISFQTHLLALNAAVEAARAGEAGAGFAVVSGEVKNLAQRAAEAAMETATQIDGIEQKVRIGYEQLETNQKSIATLTGSVIKVGNLIERIAAASREQAGSIEHSNQVVAQMRQVVTLNAENADLSVEAFNDLVSQVEILESCAFKLAELLKKEP